MKAWKRFVREQGGWAAYGGIIFKGDRVLLRKPTNNFGGYAWTFPKGAKNRDETPEEAAVRETYEETGYVCQIVGKVPGIFQGTSSTTEFWIMTPVSQEEIPINPELGFPETERIAWADYNTAQRLIAQTGQLGNQPGMQRDLEILDAAFKAKGLPIAENEPEEE